MAGIDARTGRPLGGWPHVVQSIGILLTTALGHRVMRRHVGSVTPQLLGRLLNGPTMLRLLQSIAIPIELFEPRFRVLRVRPISATREGRAEILIEGEYRPRGHLGDFTPEGTRRVTLALGGAGKGIEVT